ncbi:NADH-quinone oxidoreductase subunit J [Isoptericola sp. b441]|uniref:NADH-quinone oxidoreductase subunit J n=1 Tax=Actinotalea lenta TaxID=3064654 RepID=A0ABT9D9R0_9CELL|nr:MULTISPECIES: NADH-quinone oxidoreductase subunit J [unclassified Isoptericola]MDO8107625.1 NADH-quinone oxidoreductase subunit J [Isoptericola sp. b441]MDO8120714.1 NADH-quinone oxidoreductase subunit J [Isoptericola sp. b490]
MIGTIVFWVAALVAVAAGVEVFRTDSMARASYALAASFVAVGVMLLAFELDYLGVIVILMMVMEMAIMALFMIMLMGMNPALMPMSMVHGKRTATVVAAVVFVGLAAAALLIPWPDRAGAPAADLTRSLGDAVMGSKMLVMLTVSPVLFATIIGALVLGHPRDRYQRYGDDLERDHPDDPIQGGVGR